VHLNYNCQLIYEGAIPRWTADRSSSTIKSLLESRNNASIFAMTTFYSANGNELTETGLKVTVGFVFYSLQASHHYDLFLNRIASGTVYNKLIPRWNWCAPSVVFLITIPTIGIISMIVESIISACVKRCSVRIYLRSQVCFESEIFNHEFSKSTPNNRYHTH